MKDVFIKFSEKEKYDMKSPISYPDCIGIQETLERYAQEHHLDPEQKIWVWRSKSNPWTVKHDVEITVVKAA